MGTADGTLLYYCRLIILEYSLYVAPFVTTQIRPNFQGSIGNKKCTDALRDNYLELMWNSFCSSQRVCSTIKVC